MYSEDDLLPISALQHLLFCERQCALIHLEQLWAENRLTVEGGLMHERVHEADAETRPGIRIVRGLRLRSLHLGVTGVADVVEFHDTGGKGTAQPYPVEYKRGKPKPDACDEVQLCAQAMCLEEMLGCTIPEGALFYGLPRRRHEVTFDPVLRDEVERRSHHLHELLDSGRTPPAVYDTRCKQCSLLELCMPRSAGGGKSATVYLKEATQE